VDPAVTPLRLTRAPQGVGVTAGTRERRAYAGAFRDLRTEGTRRENGMTAISRYRFTPDWIEVGWSLSRPTTAAVDVAILFPSWGRGARVTVAFRDGRTVRLGARPIALTHIRLLPVASIHSGYSIKPLGVPPGATVRIVTPRAQASAPDPGPTVVVGLGKRSRSTHVGFTARITVTHALAVMP
jgi:hypothetical protein